MPIGSRLSNPLFVGILGIPVLSFAYTSISYLFPIPFPFLFPIHTSSITYSHLSKLEEEILLDSLNI